MRALRPRVWVEEARPTGKIVPAEELVHLLERPPLCLGHRVPNEEECAQIDNSEEEIVTLRGCGRQQCVWHWQHANAVAA